jgi:hypothetical protein
MTISFKFDDPGRQINKVTVSERTASQIHRTNSSNLNELVIPSFVIPSVSRGTRDLRFSFPPATLLEVIFDRV